MVSARRRSRGGGWRANNTAVLRIIAVVVLISTRNGILVMMISILGLHDVDVVVVVVNGELYNRSNYFSILRIVSPKRELFLFVCLV